MGLLKWLLPSGRKRSAANLLDQIVRQARDPRFYTEAGVPDTLDGRFDMIVAHLIIVLHRLKGPEHEPLSQALFDFFFANMDDSLREMGVGDLSVPKRIKAMSEAVYGRIEAYDAPLTHEDAEALAAALQRNVYRDRGAEDAAAEAQAKELAVYLLAAARKLKSLPDSELKAGRLTFETPQFETKVVEK